MNQIIKNSISESLENLKYPKVEFSLQVPRDKKHGDLATNVSFLLSKLLKKPPIDIAEKIKKDLNKSGLFTSITIAQPGFINLKLNVEILAEKLNFILNKNESYGKNLEGKGKKVLVEFVSANPTGPLTVGHGRGAVVGDCISNILKWNGYNVSREYYYNNAGRQMRILAESTYARYLELLNKTFTMPEDGYQGEYIINIAQNILDEHGGNLCEKDLDVFKKYTENIIFKNIKSTLNDIGLIFDSFFNEKTLYENKSIYNVIEKLKNKNLIYEKDNATWFNGTKVGRESDKVLIKSTGEPTYRLPDMAYHIDKFKRNYDLIIDVFGADHMDAYPDVLEVLNQLEYNIDKVKVIIHQFISILQNGQQLKMSTRKANFITLDKLIKEVGSDAVRYFFIMRNVNSHLNFDLDIAKEKSENNPVYYIQYAHARICTILSKTEINNDKSDLSLLSSDEDIKIIYKTVEFENLVIKLRNTLEPQILANYLHELASMFHKYYAHNRIITENVELSKARIVLVKAIKIVIKNGLNILGISAPKSM